MSYQNSLENSFQRNKQNFNPNCKRTGLTSHIKLSQIRQSLSVGEDPSMLSIFKTINQKPQNTFQSFKYKNQGHSLVEVLCLAFGRTAMTIDEAIQLCQKMNIYNKEDIIKIMEGRQSQLRSKTLKSCLRTDLGALKIQQMLCSFKQEKSLKKYHQQILELILPEDLDDSISIEVVEQAYKIFKDDLQCEEGQQQQLCCKFEYIKQKKIQPKLWNDKFKININKLINASSQKGRLTFKGLKKALENFLNEDELCVIFRYLYYLENQEFMPIADRTKTIKSKLISQQILNQQQSIEQLTNNQPKQYALEESNKLIQALLKQKQKMLEQLNSKDKEIERLNKIVDLHQLERDQEKKITEDRVKMEVQGCKNKYEKLVCDLRKSNDNKRQVIEWYQAQLEAVTKKLSEEKIMMNKLTRDIKYW